MRIIRPQNRREGGFSLVELLVAMSIMGILSAVFGNLMMMQARWQATQEMTTKAHDALEIVKSGYDPQSEQWPTIEYCSFEVIDYSDDEQWDRVAATCTRGPISVTRDRYIDWGSDNGTSQCVTDDANNGHGNDCDGYDEGNPGKGNGK